MYFTSEEKIATMENGFSSIGNGIIPAPYRKWVLDYELLLFKLRVHYNNRIFPIFSWSLLNWFVVQGL